MLNIFGETFDVEFEIYIEDRLIQKQKMQAPKEILIMNFVQTANQIIKDSRPMRIRMTRQKAVWDNFEMKDKILDLEVELHNKAMEIWEENRKGDIK